VAVFRRFLIVAVSVQELPVVVSILSASFCRNDVIDF
jgi:hypothetical protein